MSKFFLFISIFCVKSLFTFEIVKKPIQEISIIKPKNYPKSKGQHYVNKTPRLSTCTGAAWSADEKCLIVAHFDYGAIYVYDFDENLETAILSQIVESTDKLNLQSVDNICISPDGQFLALSINHRKSIVVFEFDKEKKRIVNSNFVVFESPDPNCHGINFSKNSDYLYFTTIRPDGGIHVCKLKTKNQLISIDYLGKIKNDFYPYKPKSIDFSFDDKYLAIIFANNIMMQPSMAGGAIGLYIIKKDEDFLNPKLVSYFQDSSIFFGGDDLRFFRDTYQLIVSEQPRDEISIFEIDPSTHELRKKSVVLTKETSNISLPHGICISPSGRYLIVCNFGLNNFSIFKIE